jgi:uncharacterized protein with GYD domain
MAKYMFQGSYSVEGARGLLREGGSRRREAVAQLVRSLGGQLEGFYYAFGDTDLYMIVDLPEHAHAAAASLIVAASGAGRWRTIVLLDPEDMDRAARSDASYTPPAG